ncbi:MAG: radical SAM protein [Clostridia bacterium]|nr:radical SAM protein [Clostridia bacterium]
MYISKHDSLSLFEFFASLQEEGEMLTPRQTELAYAVISQIELSVQSLHERLISEIPGVKTFGGRTLYVGSERHFPRGCISCLKGTGLGAIRKSNRCNAACPFCYDYGVLDQIPPIGEGMWEIGGTKYREEDLELLLKIQKRPSGVAYVYLEPFTEIEKYYSFIKKVHSFGIYQHLYTNGINAHKDELKALGEAGLDEIRFNLGASMCADRVIENIRAAKDYIPMVGIETPMTEDFHARFIEKKDYILSTGLDFINLAELHLNPNNLENYIGENMYMYRHGYVSPIASRVLTLRTMKLAAEENWACTVHDCSNRTKFARDINLKAKEGAWFGASAYGCEFEEIPFAAFLPVLSDDSFSFLREEPLPEGWRLGDIVV